MVYCGDLNVAHREIALKNPKQNIHSAGFSYEERQKMTDLLMSGFVDTLSLIHIFSLAKIMALISCGVYFLPSMSTL